MCLQSTVTVLSGALFTKQVGSTVSTPPRRFAAARSPWGAPAASTKPTWTITPMPSPADTRRKSRREIEPGAMRFRGRMESAVELRRGLMDRGANSHVGSAAAHVARHRMVDVGIRWTADLREQRSRRHDLSRLAIAALWDVETNPRGLHRIGHLALKPFDRDDLRAFDGGDRRHARAARHAIDVHRAGTALGDAASVLGPCEMQLVPKHPKQRRVGFDIHLDVLSVDREGGHRSLSVPFLDERLRKNRSTGKSLNPKTCKRWACGGISPLARCRTTVGYHAAWPKPRCIAASSSPRPSSARAWPSSPAPSCTCRRPPPTPRRAPPSSS